VIAKGFGEVPGAGKTKDEVESENGIQGQPWGEEDPCSKGWRVSQGVLKGLKGGVTMEGMGIPEREDSALKPAMKKISPDMEPVGHIVINSTGAMGIPAAEDRERQEPSENDEPQFCDAVGVKGFHPRSKRTGLP
jgi:hypothetical protein